MESYRSEGVVLHALPFRDFDQILTIFSKDEGIVKLMVKKASATTPMSQIEFVYTKGRSEILKCQEVSVLNLHLNVRKSLPHLEAACDLLRAIQASQWAGRPAPDLYKLFVIYLNKIPNASNPYIYAASFRLKILKHEGLLNENITGFSQQDAEVLSSLAFCRSMSELANLTISSSLFQKIQTLFLEQL